LSPLERRGLPDAGNDPNPAFFIRLRSISERLVLKVSYLSSAAAISVGKRK
jgi:hypothetical protein